MILLDTSFLVELLKGRSDARKKLEELQSRPLGVSAVSVSELLYGEIKQRQEPSTELLLANYAIIPFDLREAKAAARIRVELEKHGGRIGPEDEMIAATARVHGVPLLTRNTKHFRRVKGLKVDTW